MDDELIGIEEATRLAQMFVGTEAELTRCDRRPVQIYQNRPANAEFFFCVYRPRDHSRVGGSEVIAVDRVTGTVRNAGMVGE